MADSNELRYCYSFEEYGQWNYDPYPTREAALTAARYDNDHNGPVWTGRIETHDETFTRLIRRTGESIIERLREELVEEIGCEYENAIECDPGAYETLGHMVLEWVQENCTLTSAEAVVEIEKHEASE